jgi:hypothetical protein
MDGEVAHVHHLSPREFRQFEGCVFRDIARRFSDDLKPADEESCN